MVSELWGIAEPKVEMILLMFCDVFMYYQEKELTIATWLQRFTNAEEKKLPA